MISYFPFFTNRNDLIRQRLYLEAYLVKTFINLLCVMLVASLFCLPTVGSAGTLTFETRPDSTAPTDNEELTSSYIDASTSVTFGFDINNDLSIDVNARFEKRGTDPTYAYVTDTDDDLDKTGTGEGGAWVLRNPRDAEPNALNLLNSAFLIKYSGTLSANVSGQIWDIDAGEQYNIEAFNEFNTFLFSTLTPVGPGTCCGGPADGLPFTFSFTNAITPVATIRITQIQGDRAAGFAFDNFSTTEVPEPSSVMLILGGIAVLAVRLKRRIDPWQSS